MGLFGKTKQIERMLKAGGNFAFVAQNIATIYYVVDRLPEAQRFTQKQKYYATALFDLMAYIEDGELFEEDVRDIADKVQSGIIDFKLSGYNNPGLKALTLLVEISIFLFVIPDPATVIPQVFNNLKIISDIIDLTLEEGERGALYFDVLRNVSNWIKNPKYLEWILKYDVQDDAGEESVKNDNNQEQVLFNGERLFCRKCGQELLPDSLFCNHCGTKVIRNVR